MRRASRHERLVPSQAAGIGSAQLDEALAIAGLGLWSLDPDNGAMAWSGELFRLLGIEQMTPTRAVLNRVLHPEDRAAFWRTIDDALRAGADRSFQHRIIWPDGTIRVLAGVARIVRNSDGGTRKVFGTLQDVTKLQALLDHLRLNEWRLLQAHRLGRLRDFELDLGSMRLTHVPRPLGSDPPGPPSPSDDLFPSIHPNDLAALKADLSALAASGEPVEREFRLLTGEGTEQVQLVRAELRLDAEGRPTTLLGLAQDITDLARIREALRASELRYKVLVDHACDIVAHLDADGRCMYVSPAVREVLGRPVESRIGLADGGLLVPPDARKQAEMLADLQRGALDQIATGAPAEASLVWLASFIEAAFEDTRVAVFALDGRTSPPDLRCVAAPSIGDALRPDAGAPVNAPSPWASVCQEGHPHLALDVENAPEWRHHKTFARVRRIRAWHTHPALDATGGLLGVVSFLFDRPRPPTPRHQAALEAAARLVGLALAQRNCQVELQAKQAELERANEVLRAEHQSMDEFVATISHEIRNPLHILLGYLNLLRAEVGGPLNRDQADFVLEADKAGLRMSRLVDDLLDLARIRAGTLTMELRQTNIHGLVTSVMNAVRGRACAQGVALAAEISPHLAASTDEGRTTQVLWNLIGNALKFTPPGGLIHVRASEEAGCVRVEVADTGVGIAEEELAGIFSRYQQLEAGRPREHEGVGLGLSICKAIVEAQGGRIGVESMPGIGSMFWFTLPREGGVE